MAAPDASAMKKKAVKFYKQKLGPEAEEYLDVLFSKVESSWKKWEKGITFGGLQVSGGGVGAWSGTGNGGSMQGQPFTMDPFTFKNNSSQQLQFSKGLAFALKEKFSKFPSSFKFSGVTYTGTSKATTVNPGPVNAENAMTPLDAAGKGTAPSGIADLWAQQLQPPEFQLDNPQAKSGDLIKAISKAIESSFSEIWLMNAKITGNSLSAAGAPGGAVTGIPSENNGKLV